MLKTFNIQKIDDYQVKELYDGKLLINYYDMSVKYAYELESEWKAFCFDALHYYLKHDLSLEEFANRTNLLQYMVDKHSSLTFDTECFANINKYPNLEDYIPFSEWKEIYGNNLVELDDGFYLFSKEK